MIVLQYILSFLLILCEVHIIHLNPTHLSTPPNLLSIPATSPPKENKQTNILLGKLWCVTQWTLLPKQLYLQMLIAVGRWTGSRSLLLLHYQHWVLSAILLLLPKPWRSYIFGSAGPTLSHSPVDAGVGQVTALDVGLGDS